MVFFLLEGFLKLERNMSTGKINVAVENIFPLIKKFLYSDHEIFLRELISNATDATLKLKHLTQIGEAKVAYGNPQIEVKVDKKAKKLHIIDQGVGMTADEVNKYINEVAFSGALKSFWNNIKTVQKTVGLSVILVWGSTQPLWSPKKLKSLPSLIRMSQRHIGLVMGLQSLLWKNTIRLNEEQKSFCTSIRTRKSFWKNPKFARYSRNTTSLCPFRSNWAPKKSPKLLGKAKMP